MAERFDTSWFDLKNYEVFKAMSIKDWIGQLEARTYYHMFQSNDPKLSLLRRGKDLSSIVTELKAGIIPDDANYPSKHTGYAIEKILKGHPFSTASVNSLRSYDLWELSKKGNSRVADACQSIYDLSFSNDSNKMAEEIAFAPHDFGRRKFSYADSMTAHVTIDLSATDEQIKNDFAHWLKNYRHAINYQPQKKLFTQADFDYWVQYGVIPYLDIMLIAKIECKKITQNQLARLIFPNEYDVDIVGRLRQVTKPEAERLIKNQIHRTLSTQLVAEKVG